ncbi:MAG TPA: hypothetical protein VL832_18490 [Puia sp.]|nr:hypothetical protein [Puia sp.]
MHASTITREQKVMESKESLPYVSLVLPFEPKMTAKSEWEPILKAALRKVEKDLMAGYSSEEAMPLITRLQFLLNNLNTATHKKSIAVFVSPVVEKVMYMDIPMEEKVVVGAPFRVRDLVNCRKKGIEYLVLLLSARQSKMYRAQGTGLRLIKSNAPQNVFAYLNEVPERVANFSDPSGRRETMLDKFLHQMDTGLSLILKAYPLPVFVLGDSRVTGHFAKITRNDRHIATYIHKNCLEAGEQQLLDYLQPYITDWQEVSRQDALRQVEKAHDAGKLAIGLDEVSKMAKYKSSRLLVVEEGMMEAAPHPSTTNFFISGKVDTVIQQVLENGGDVQWVDKDKLKDYGHIALVQHY